ncbi:O-methyltransferase [Moheibacter lacus]|uniref:Class I SAM-dependent methyltransferase n=1 Tax=Moheibacter lacus TaxID=2745851 RepID=A0A838ZIL9_9FLAO|nr:O-methyltransferase [Moheibacter lacus]MBA5629511.1 class I SAM-dependent methyltransferase [Moheibacter lacus]
MEFLSNELENYLNQNTTPVSDLLNRLEKETFQKTTQPQMLSGAYQGRMLSLISKMIRPNRILEIGTFTGYATLCLAEGLQKTGKIITIDRNEELMYLPKKYFAESEFAEQIEIQIGNALDVLDELDESFDLVFIDADKSNYINYFNKVIEKMNSGGVILADNVLWYGKVLEESKPKDKDTIVLKEFNDLVANDDRVETIILPIRDGISLIRKK